MRKFFNNLKQHWMKILFGVICTVGGLYYGFKDADFHSIFREMGKANYLIVLIFAIETILSFYLRGLRWYYMCCHRYKVPVSKLYQILTAGFALNSLLPLRAGEFARPVFLNQKHKVPVSFGLSTIVVERIYDMFVILMLFVPLFYSMDIDPDFQLSFGKYTLDKAVLEDLIQKVSIMAAIGLAGLIAIQFKFIQKLGYSFLKLFQKKVSPKLYQKVYTMYGDLLHGFSSFRDWKLVLINFVLSFAVWFSVGLGFYIIGHSMNMDVSMYQCMIVMLMVCFGVMIPSAPGYWGLFELAGMFGLALLGFKDADKARAFILMVHFWQTIVIVGSGLFFISRMKISLSNILDKEPS